MKQKPRETRSKTNLLTACSLPLMSQPALMEGLSFKWNKATKDGAGSTLFVGTSPAFEFAIYSVCALAIFPPPNVLTECTCQIFKTMLRITAKQLSVKVKKVQAATGKVNTAYPSSVIGKLNIAQARNSNGV